jgi:type II secretory pathway component PulC
LKDGDIITGINGFQVATNQNWQEISKGLQGERTYRVELLRNGQVHVLLIDVEY